MEKKPAGYLVLVDDARVAGAAALSICESLILALRDRDLLDDKEVDGLLEDVVSTHRNADPADGEADLHEAVARLVGRMLRADDGARAAPRLRAERPNGA